MLRELLVSGAVCGAVAAHATPPTEIVANNTRAIVYLQVEDANGGVLDRGTGFIVSHDGYIVTAAHLKVEPNQKMWAVIGQREGIRFPLQFREADEDSDTAIWQLPQSASCRYAATLSDKRAKVMDKALVIGFPGKEGLTPAAVDIENTASQLGFYKANGYLEPGDSGAPVFNEAGKVIALVEGGRLPGTNNNDLVPISAAISLLKKRGAEIGIDAPIPFESSCYASCANPANGIAGWTTQMNWAKDTGWLPGGNNYTKACNALMAGIAAAQPGSQVELSPCTQTFCEDNKHGPTVLYKYHCKGLIRSGPIYATKQSPACGLWQ
ncbi:MAG TPA: serine protease [Rhizobiaceae bacterium]|nr:serine protease [Rhizobiaceae bacterium]